MSRNRFADAVAIVTGGASGIGRALCKEIALRGAFVVATDIDETGAHTTARMITESGGRASAAVLDVTDRTAVSKLVGETRDRSGRLDYMFNNAGIAIGGQITDMSPEHWRRIVDINLMGVIHGTDAAYRVMKDQGFGHIVNTASLAGLIPTPLTCAYAATKHAVVGFSTALRYEAELFNIKVSVVCPGVVKTEIFERAEILFVHRANVLDLFPFQMEAPAAARAILSGVIKNRAVITFPLSTSVSAYLYRLCPALLSPVIRIMLGRFLEHKDAL